MVKTNFSEFTNIYFFMAFVPVTFKTNKHEQECHILNQLLLFQNSFLYKIYKNNHMNSFNINN